MHIPHMKRQLSCADLFTELLGLHSLKRQATCCREVVRVPVLVALHVAHIRSNQVSLHTTPHFINIKTFFYSFLAAIFQGLC